jgi:cytochrome c-type biogenesis protein CcmH
MKSKSPLPPFFKGGKDSGCRESRHARRCRLSSPFEKGGLRGICLSLLTALLLTASTAFAQSGADPTPLQFHDRAEETRFRALVAELRCVMCQNQSLADSNAQIAHDLRREVLTLMRQGKDDAQIKDFLVARYGDFVLYRPRVESTTWLLWFGPAALLLAGGALVVVIVRRRSRRAPVVSDDAQEW